MTRFSTLISINHLRRLRIGTLSVFCTYPLELTRVRLAYYTRSLQSSDLTLPEVRPSLRTAVSHIYQETAAFKPQITFLEDLRASPSPAKTLRAHLFYHVPLFSFYRGFAVTLLGMVPYAGTSFLTWGYLRSVLLPPPTKEMPKPKPTPLLDLTIGAVSGSAAQTVSYPFEIVRRRMQVGGLMNADPNAWLGFGETVRKIWMTQGWRGFYVGLTIGYMKVVPMTATSFAVWQWGKRILGV